MQINKPTHQWQLSFEGDWPTSVAFLGDSRRIAAGNRAGQIFIWELPESPPKKKQSDKDKKEVWLSSYLTVSMSPCLFVNQIINHNKN